MSSFLMNAASWAGPARASDASEAATSKLDRRSNMNMTEVSVDVSRCEACPCADTLKRKRDPQLALLL
eukprot:6138682-Prymnesium_polylepis.1